MKPDDETLLSAYLDDELGPGPREEVESALRDAPALAADLAELRSVHRAVADLPRPAAPCRMASSVLAQVASAESARRRRPYYWVATAASLVFGFLLTLRSGLISHPVQVPVAEALGPRLGGWLAVADGGGADADVQGAPVEVRPEPRVAVAEAPLGPAEDPDAESRAQVVRMLDGPGLGRIVVAADGEGDGPDAAARVDEILRGSARKEPKYARVSVGPGLQVDPGHPEGGEVFVVRMDDLERREMLDRLRRAFGTVVDEPSLDPRLGTQVVELAGITLGAGREGAGLKPHPEARVALQHPESEIVHKETHIVPGIPGSFRRDQLDGAPVVHQGPAGPDELLDKPEPARTTRPTGLAPVLIWVARGPAGH
jgi:hypothetical protein